MKTNFITYALVSCFMVANLFAPRNPLQPLKANPLATKYMEDFFKQKSLVKKLKQEISQLKQAGIKACDMLDAEAEKLKELEKELQELINSDNPFKSRARVFLDYCIENKRKDIKAWDEKIDRIAAELKARQEELKRRTA